MILVLCVMAGCAGKEKLPPDFEKPYQRSTYSFDQGLYPSDQDLFLRYRINPGDVLDVMFQIKSQKAEEFKINLYHEIQVKFPDLPNLSSTQKIMPTGKIALPYIGEVYVLDKTVNEATRMLKEKYSTTFVDPQVTVNVTNIDERIEQIRRDLE